MGDDNIINSPYFLEHVFTITGVWSRFFFLRFLQYYSWGYPQQTFPLQFSSVGKENAVKTNIPQGQS